MQANREIGMTKKIPPRTYNQTHHFRQQTPGRRRVSIYVSWSYPAEANRNIAELDNRFSTMTDVRRVLWPNYESAEWSDPLQFQQGIAGSLELFFWGWIPFQQYVGEVTGHVVPVFQRIDQAGFKLPIDERILADVDTLMIFGLDHTVTAQEAEPEEIAALKNFLKRDGTCLILGPHHAVGASDDMKIRDMEYYHHGDALVPRQQCFAGYLRSIIKGLGIPVENRWGLRPAVEPGTRQPVPLSIAKELDTKGWLAGVTRFVFHMHLPHYEVTTDDTTLIRVLARQPIDLSKPHPFTEMGNREFNTFLWMPPSGERAGDILFADSTIFSTLFGVDESVKQFWKNISTI
jgi:hypothetical protein